VRTVTADWAENDTFQCSEVPVETDQLRVGAKLVVSTSEGEEEDEVTRVLVDAVDAGLWVVETARNGRVVVMRGRAESYTVSWQG
jgi:hypothetical protein